MIFCVYADDGMILQTGVCAEDSTLEHIPGKKIKGIPETTRGSTHYVDVSADPPVVVEFPPRPGKWYAFDYATRSWAPDLAGAIDARKADVDAERQRRNVLPITVGAITLDADLVAQRNLSDKMTEVAERIRLGIQMPAGLLLWKDYDNVVHTFADIQTYFDWMSAYTVALAERGTRLYIAGWAHKDAIAALTTVEAVEAYSIDGGWL